MANSMGFRAFDYVEFYVGSARFAAEWHVRSLGFTAAAYSGPETGHRDRVSYYLTQGDVKIVVTSALRSATGDVQDFLKTHGDGVKRVAYAVDDVSKAYELALKGGAQSVSPPRLLEDAEGIVAEAAVRIYDDTEICFVNADKYRGKFRPGFGQLPNPILPVANKPALQRIDHIVGNVRRGEMDKWASWFHKAFGFETFVDFKPGDIATQYSALLSKVVRSSDNAIKHPINEPYDGLKKSQIEEFLDEYEGSGIQHIAIATGDIITAIANLRANGTAFLEAPSTYYDALRARKLPIKEDIDVLQKYGILCDFEGDGYLLQLFTKPIGDRPTFFYEIIQRQGNSQGFGKGNFQALFESIELDQAKRGNL